MASGGGQGLRWGAGEHKLLLSAAGEVGGRCELARQGLSSRARAVGAFCLPPSEGEC